MPKKNNFELLQKAKEACNNACIGYVCDVDCALGYSDSGECPFIKAAATIIRQTKFCTECGQKIKDVK